MMCRRLEQLVKRYERGEMRRVEWLDGMSMRAVDRLRDEVPSHTVDSLSMPVATLPPDAAMEQWSSGILLHFCLLSKTAQQCSMQVIVPWP